VELNTGVPGLFLVYNFLTEAEERTLVESIETFRWDSNRAKTRRVQLYVPWREEPKSVIIPKSSSPAIPASAKTIAEKIISVGKVHFKQYDWENYNIQDEKCCELQINEYHARDALGFHKDNPIAYTEVICGVSLLTDSWIHYQYLNEEIKVLMPKRSLYLMTGKSRYKWKHGIPPDSLVGGEKRISLTFRKVMYTKSLK